jgi:hypothetical protein
VLVKGQQVGEVCATGDDWNVDSTFIVRLSLVVSSEAAKRVSHRSASAARGPADARR